MSINLTWVPRWMWWHGLAPHGLAGLVLTIILSVMHTSPAACLVACTAVAFAHELGDGDFKTANQGPENGLLDALMFLPAPLVLWLANVVL